MSRKEIGNMKVFRRWQKVATVFSVLTRSVRKQKVQVAHKKPVSLFPKNALQKQMEKENRG